MKLSRKELQQVLENGFVRTELRRLGRALKRRSFPGALAIYQGDASAWHIPLNKTISTTEQEIIGEAAFARITSPDQHMRNDIALVIQSRLGAVAVPTSEELRRYAAVLAANPGAIGGRITVSSAAARDATLLLYAPKPGTTLDIEQIPAQSPEEASAAATAAYLGDLGLHSAQITFQISSGVMLSPDGNRGPYQQLDKLYAA